MLTISNYQKKYPGSNNPVLSIETLHLDKGTYWLKGENGSGKTSLMKSIAGLIPFNGDIQVNNLHIHKQRMAYTAIVNYAEAEPLYPLFLTGKEMISFYCATKKGPFPQQLFNDLGVEHFQHQKRLTYSSCMIKKLSIVLAFIGNPSLILLDEPLIALDTASVTILQQTIASYHHSGVSFIITSHQPLDETIIKQPAALLVKDHLIHTIA